jgi:hypothetical protein
VGVGNKQIFPNSIPRGALCGSSPVLSLLEQCPERAGERRAASIRRTAWAWASRNVTLG